MLLTRLGCALALLLSLLTLPAMAADASNPTDTGKSTDASKLELLNVSYDVSREFYKDFNAAFGRYWQNRHSQTVTLQQSHGGSSKQARAVIDGLAADVVTMNQQSDIDAIAAKGLIRADWRSRLPFASAPYSSTIVFLVRKGNPKAIKDWDDLVKTGVGVIIPNPKTSGNGRYSYLATWGYALRRGDSDAQARDFTARLFRNVPILDAGGRAATTTFIQRGIGDVLLTFESEIQLIVREFNPDDFQVVYPSLREQAKITFTI
jgi:sulfate transport system substrate-binding protein